MTNLATTLPIPRAKPEKDWLSRKEAAIYLTRLGCKIAPQTLAKYASNQNARRGPSYTRVGWKMVQYRREDLETWARLRMVRVD